MVEGDRWNVIKREDDYPLTFPIDLSSNKGRSLMWRTLLRTRNKFEISKRRFLNRLKRLIRQDLLNKHGKIYGWQVEKNPKHV